jgi:RHS repeat-associated protein
MNLAPCFTSFSLSTGCSSTSTGNNGSVTGIINGVDTNETQNFTYDALNRIASAATKATSGNDCWGQSFGPDAVANLTSIGVSQCTAGSLSVTTDGYNHLSATGYSYDAAGDMTSDGSYTYTYDAENRITSANGVTYTYDGNDLRVEKSSGTLYWRSIAGDVLAESDLQGNITNEYVFFAGRRIARISSGTVNYFYSDAVGTVHTITDASGNACYDASFTPYGQEVLNPNISQTCSSNYKFAGYEYDSETGLYYAKARYYNPRLGRFMSVDPLRGDPGNPQSLNQYAYVLNNPENRVDPTGSKAIPQQFQLFTWDELMGFYVGMSVDAFDLGCTADLVDTPCSLVDAMLQGGQAFQCPNNDCVTYTQEQIWQRAYDAEHASEPQSQQAPCSAKIQAAVQSDLNPTSLTNLGPTSGPGLDSSGMRGGAYNVNFFETGVTLGPPGTATAIPGTTCGRFSDGLHIPIPGAPGCPDLNDPTIFTGESAVYNNMSGFFFTAHIDSGNANTVFGAIQHFFIDVILGNLGFHHGC